MRKLYHTSTGNFYAGLWNSEDGSELLHMVLTLGVSAQKHFVEQGFSVDDKEPLVSLEKEGQDDPLRTA